MKKSKLFMAYGTLVLAAAAVFATKANKRFTSIATVYINASGEAAIYGGTNIFTNTFGMGVTPKTLNVKMRTIGGVVLKTATLGNSLAGALLTTVGGSKKINYK